MALWLTDYTIDEVRQELLGLVSNHIKADDSETSNAQAIVMVNGTASIGTPKSNDSYRTMPIQGSTRHYTRQLRQTEDKFVGESLKKPVQLCNPPISGISITKHWRQAKSNR